MTSPTTSKVSALFAFSSVIATAALADGALPASTVGLSVAPPVAEQQSPSGYDTFVYASSIVFPDIGEVQFNPYRYPPAEKLRIKREALKQNEEVLKLLRQAIAAGIAFPLRRTEDQLLALQHRVEDFKDVLKSENLVSQADNDWPHAWGAQITLAELSEIASAGEDPSQFKDFEINLNEWRPIVLQQSVTALRDGARRMKAADAKHLTPLQLHQSQQQWELDRILWNFGGQRLAKDRQEATKLEVQKSYAMSAEQMTEFLALTPETAATQVKAYYATVFERDALPYSQAKKALISRNRWSYTLWDSPPIPDIKNLYNWTIHLTNRRLLEGALELRAIKLETGKYPASFEAQLDPFGDGTPLIYQRDKDSYQLYSVGPDSLDDGGDIIQKLETSPLTGQPGWNYTTRLDSMGDILAPVF